MADSENKVYKGFLGRWQLISESCQYDQGEPPTEGSYEITDEDGVLHFTMIWTDACGENHRVTFSGLPDGSKQPFSGGDLADALSVTAVSERELRSSAFYQGKELMVAQRQLDETGQAMRITQVVRLPDGSQPANVSVYRRELMH